MENQEIYSLMAKVSKKRGPMSEDERKYHGFKRFRRKAFSILDMTHLFGCSYFDGIRFFGSFRTEKTLDEMAKLLHETGIASSLGEGREMVPEIVGCKLSLGCDTLTVEKANHGDNNEKYMMEYRDHDLN